MIGTLPCLICGDEVRLSGSRLQELVKRGELPVCRKNGCFRSVGFRERQDDYEKSVTARKIEVVLRQKVALTVATEGPRRMGQNGQPLARRKVRRSAERICKAAGAEDQ